MGRTQRKRKRRERHFYTCNELEEIKHLNLWLSHQGLRCNGKLVLAIFRDTGRGLLTKKKICAGEELINLPLNATLNVTSLLIDSIFCNIFNENKVECFLKYRQKLSFQSLMAFYLNYLKLYGSNSKWSNYLKSLPNDYSVPYFLSDELKYNIDSEIQAVVAKQTDIVHSSFIIFSRILESNCSNNPEILTFKCSFSRKDYEWAYFTVNTRCVFLDLTKIIDLSNRNNTILDLICDNINISLCPYLDMINHNPNAKNETRLLVSNTTQNIKISNLKAELLNGISFSIYTKDSFEPYTQVFICYGDSHNLKLVTEYGFYIKDNELDCVNFDFNYLKSFLLAKGNKLSEDQLSFINMHGLDKDLYIDSRGLSFHLYALLMVIKYYYSKDMDVSRLIYTAAIYSKDNSLNELIIPVVRSRLSSIRESITKLGDNTKQCIILNNCVALMCQYANILESFIKC